MKYSVTHPTPRNMRYVWCDVCGFKKHLKDTVWVKDKRDLYNGLLVCKTHVNKHNPQRDPIVVKEKLV